MDVGYLPERHVDHAGVATLPDPLAQPVDRAPAVSFEDFYAAAFPKVYAFIRCHVRTADIAQELVSRVFAKAYRHRHNLSTHAATLWVFRIAHTTVIDYWRVEHRRESVSVPIDEIVLRPADGLDPEAAYERKQRAAHLFRLMGELSDDDRILLALKFSAQQTNREIARILTISEGAVSMRLLRALRRLRDRLQAIGWQ